MDNILLKYSADDKKNELAIFKKWQNTQDPKHFRELYSSMKPLIYAAAKKAAYGSNLPESAYKIYAAQSFYDALKTYKPDKGAELQTHVYGAVQNKAKRLNYLYQDIGYKPEPRAMQVGLYQNEVANLHDELQRTPTPQEIATRLDWSVKEVDRIQKEIHKELAIEGGTEEYGVFESNELEEVLDHLYHELTQEEQRVYDLMLGKHGQPRMSKVTGRVDFDRIGRTLGFSSSKVRMVANRIKAKYEKAAKI